jgi:ABC-type molybdate transport system ATPase subunit
MESAFPDIARFADIGEFLDRPVREYSTGMYLRLAFSTAIHARPEILVVDEVLAVGDAIFANRCVQKFEELKQSRVTVIFVSHDLGLVKRLADRAILIDEGRIAAEGAPSAVVNRYVGMALERHRRQGAEPSPVRRALEHRFRHGDGQSRVTAVQMLNAQGTPSTSFRSGEPVTVRIVAQFMEDADNPVAGILVRNRLGIDVYGTNTRIEGHSLGRQRQGESLEIEFAFPCLFTPQEYTLTVATQHWDGSSQDWLDDVLSFSVSDVTERAGVASWEAAIRWRKAGA